jgi:uncharacterized protein YggT (Ycf19 family)
MATYDPRTDPNAPPAAPVSSASPLTPVRRLVGILFGVVVTLIAIRFILLLLGANAGNAIVDGIYSFTEIFVAPFRGIFRLDQVSPAGFSVIDFSALVAIIAWSLIALLVIAILRIPDRGYAP